MLPESTIFLKAKQLRHKWKLHFSESDGAPEMETAPCAEQSGTI